MNTVILIRNDSTSPVTYEDVKHCWRQNNEVVLSIGVHGKNRTYIHYPITNIDHYEVHEISTESSGIRTK